MITKNQQGIGLIEILIAMAITGIAATAIYTVYQSSTRSSAIQNTAAYAQQSARAGLEIIAPHIRMAGYDPTGDAYRNNPCTRRIDFIQDHEIRITMDFDGSGVFGGSTPIRPEIISYRLGNDGTIRQSVWEQIHSQLLANGDRVPTVSNLRFTEPIIDNVALLRFTPVCEGRRLVGVDLDLRVEEPAIQGETVWRELNTTVYMQNSNTGYIHSSNPGCVKYELDVCDASSS